MWWAPVEGRAVERAAAAVEQHLAGQRVAVGAQAGRRQADEDVAGADVLAGDEPVALGHADREADEVELAGLHGAGVLGHLAADERAAGLAAALGHALDELLDVVGVELADRDVVEEEQRLGALADEVVDAHGHEVDADGVEAAGGLGDQRLGADAVGGRHEHRVAVAVLGEGEQPAEAADVADDLGPERGADLRLDALDGLLAGGDADAGVLVARAQPVPSSVDRGLDG